MRIFILLGLLFCPSLVSGQNLILYGKVGGYDSGQGNKLYYTSKGKAFNEKEFIIFNSTRTYFLKLPIKKLEQEKIQTLLFSLDPKVDGSEKDACVYEVHVGEIIKSEAFKSKKSIEIKSDLLIDVNCIVGLEQKAEFEGGGQFVGSYQMIIGDTTHSVELKNSNYRYKAILDKKPKDQLDVELGIWSYDSNTNTLKFTVYRRANELFGVNVFTEKTYEFKVKEDGEKLSFESAMGKLEKL
ncbi:hypothetical protein QNI16_05540 [Cytophagaceae bacterium YF14B1]|uniref:Uncharacterized protein n=1 Tax=Xanthocytophaga flava TaxID=3048013 RepID=A0AAE3QJE4_9BACT|nr:hypothetical protein [Xanthocytophaga flavus]MDJ1479940.1 hypothetical protein [Xanthocytophaga flavus]